MADQAQAPVFAIQRMYLKDMSLEIPHAPAIFFDQQQPQVEVQLDVSSQDVVQFLYETSVTVTVTTKMGDKVMFLIEAKQAGIFEIRNIGDEQLQMLLNVVCPSIVYPYLRANVADIVQRSGFPPIHLAEINFEALHQQRVAQLAEEQQAAAPGIYVPGNKH